MALFSKKDDGKDAAEAQDRTAPERTAPAETADAQEWLIPEESRGYLSQLFKGLKAPVELRLFTGKGLNEEYAGFTRRFIADLTRLSDNISLTEVDLDAPEAAERGIAESPTVLMAPDRYDIRFTGAPAGEEGRTFIEAIALCSLGRSGLRQTSRDLLATLAEKRHVRVFVSPTCPYCPGQAVNAVRAAIERPELVSAQIVEISENRELAQRFGVGSVPHTVINDSLAVLGMEPEERFTAELVALRSAEELTGTAGSPGGAAEESVFRDLVIVGGGPAGLAAGIYAERAGLRSVILEKANVGGQVAATPVVENYPGMTSTSGGKLVDMLAAHAREYVDIHEFEPVQEIKVGRLIEAVTPRVLYRCRALILATGASWKALGVPGESAFHGNGVSHCASCDGALYKDRKVVVVGGGNTALTDALHLRNLGADVTVVHRRDAFRAQEHLQKSVAREAIPVLWNSEVTAVLGEGALTGVRLRDTVTGEERELACDGVFVAIGEKSETRLARQVGLRLDADGNVAVDREMRTSIPRIYGAGDVTGGLRQIVTAMGAGATAAMTAFADLKRFESEEAGDEERP